MTWADEAAVVLGGRVHAGPVSSVLDDEQLLAAAGLRRPWPLELARRLGLAGDPRGVEDVLAHLAQTGTPCQPEAPCQPVAP